MNIVIFGWKFCFAKKVVRSRFETSYWSSK